MEQIDKVILFNNLKELTIFSARLFESSLTEYVENNDIEIKSNKLLDEDGLINFKFNITITHIQTALVLMINEKNRNIINKIIKDATDLVYKYYEDNKKPHTFNEAKNNLIDNIELFDEITVNDDAIVYYSSFYTKI